MSIFKKIATLVIILLFLSISLCIIGLSFGIIVVDKNGEISVPSLSNPSPLPLDPNDPVIGTYRSTDETAICRLYGNGTYIFMSLIHPSLSFGNWSRFENNHYVFYLYLTESEGKKTYANMLPFNLPQGYDLINGELASSDSSDRFRKISGNPDEFVQVHAYPSTSPDTPINRQVGVEVKRVNSNSIYVKVMTGMDVPSLVAIRVVANGKDAPLTGGKIGPQIGSVAYYNVNDNTDIVVIAEFYDYSHYNVWAGRI